MKNTTTVEINEYIGRLEKILNQRFLMIGGFLLIMILEKSFLKVPFSNAVFFLVLVMLLASIPVVRIFRRLKTKHPQGAIYAYFVYLLFEFILLTIIIYLTGGITWVIFAFYLFYIATVFWFFPKNLAIFTVVYCNFLFILLVFLQYLRILPPQTFFPPIERTAQNLPYLTATTISIISLFSYIGYSSNRFYSALETKIKRLEEIRKQLVKTKRLLEIKVQKRTKELDKEKRILKNEIEERTKELNKRRKTLQSRVRELESFHKMAIARELEIIRLKEKKIQLKAFQQ